jgi:Cd2+/Zn2+-exporting ATPase
VFSAAGRAAFAAACFSAAAFAGGVFPARRVVAAIRSRTLDINTLMVVAVVGALVLGEWLEAAAVVFLFAVAQWLELRTMERARQAIRVLIDLSPREALVRSASLERRVPVADVRIGDEILVRPGGKVPLDGIVIFGHSDVNQAPLTGESLPADKGPGDELFAGTINGRVALDVRVTRLVQDTRLARIVHLVDVAQASRAPVQTFVDRFAGVYTPAVLVAAVAVVIVILARRRGRPDRVGLSRAGSPRDLLPVRARHFDARLDCVRAIAGGSQRRAGACLERLAAVRVVAFDKTGTLTEGQLRVTGVFPVGATRADELLGYAAAVEFRSEHPVAQAIVAHVRGSGIAVALPTWLSATSASFRRAPSTWPTRTPRTSFARGTRASLSCSLV